MGQENNIIGIQTNVNVEVGAIEKFVAAIIPNFVKEAGGILSDQVREWRYKNQIRILGKAKKYCEQHSITPGKIDLKFLVPLIENAALEEDENMQNKWAALLANAAANNENVRPSFIDILKQLNHQEALILDALYNHASQETNYEERQIMQFSKEKVQQNFKIADKTIDVILDNLFRLNLCRPPGSHHGAKLGKYPFALQTNEIFELTPLGYTFVNACKL